MTTILLMLGALVVVFGVAALATREDAAMAPVEGDRPDVVLPDGASGADVRAVRFPLAVRGYRMRDVDDVLERLAAELDARDARIATLEGRDEAVPAEAPAVVLDETAPVDAAPAGSADTSTGTGTSTVSGPTPAGSAAVPPAASEVPGEVPTDAASSR